MGLLALQFGIVANALNPDTVYDALLIGALVNTWAIKSWLHEFARR